MPGLIGEVNRLLGATPSAQGHDVSVGAHPASIDSHDRRAQRPYLPPRDGAALRNARRRHATPPPSGRTALHRDATRRHLASPPHAGGIANNGPSGMRCGVAQNMYHTLKDLRGGFAIDATVLDRPAESRRVFESTFGRRCVKASRR